MHVLRGKDVPLGDSLVRNINHGIRSLAGISQFREVAAGTLRPHIIGID